MIDNEKVEITEEIKESLERLYTPLSEAREEIQRRWHDVELRKKVTEFLHGDVLECLQDGPKSLLCRPIASANFESLLFLEESSMLGMDPVLVELTEDKFVDKNFCKYHLARLFVEQGNGKKLGHINQVYNIIDFNQWRGKRIKDITTTWDENLVDFHHHALAELGQKYTYEVFDFSDWFIKHARLSGEYYYIQYLALFICHGVLFENFLLNPEELEFTHTKVIPSFDRLINMFGVQPLIVPVQPPKYEADNYAAHYPVQFKDVLNERGI